MTQRKSNIAAIAIGRNEGERLKNCLGSLDGQVEPIIYVDSGSTDDSVEIARAAGAEVVELDMTRPFTAARARNAGLHRLREVDFKGAFVQVLDGDCELREGWLDAALSAISSSEDIAVVCGRRRERYAEATIWNQLIDLEWDTPVGEVSACGGDALMRRKALDDVCGYRNDLIAGEEPEMCFRLRKKGWKVLRIKAEMTWHDAAITRPSQWWQRTKRAGHAFAEGAALHGRSAERYWVNETRRAIAWGSALPVTAFLLSLVVGPSGLLLLLAYPAQVLRLRAKGMGWSHSFFTVLGKIPEAQGVLQFRIGRLTGRRSRLVEYK